MYVMYAITIIRKQLYIEERQDRALKYHAKELGISEAQLVRQAIDNLFMEKTNIKSDADDILRDIFNTMDKVAKTRSAPKGYRFNRQEHYEEEERRKGLD